MKYLQENLCYILILFSLCISFIGTFTKTYINKSTGQERLTIWGYIIGILLVTSTLGTLLSTIDSKKTDAVKLRQDSIRTCNDSIKLVETSAMLSQQRFINMISAVNNYSLKDTPCLVFQYHYITKEDIHSRFIPQDYSYFRKLQTFPGFGINVDTLSLHLDLDSGNLNFLTNDVESENLNDTTYFFNKYNTSVLQKPLVKKENQFVFFSNQDDGIIQYNFAMIGLNNLSELLYDLRGKKNIGSLIIINNSQTITNDQMKIFSSMFSEKNCKAYIRILLKNDKLRTINPCIDIPISIKTDFSVIHHAQINFTTKDPEMTDAFF